MNKNNPIDSFTAAVEKPLSFASRNSFAHLEKIRGLDDFIAEQARKIIGQTGNPAAEVILRSLLDAVSQYASSSFEQKKAIITRCRTGIDAIKKVSGSITADGFCAAESRFNPRDIFKLPVDTLRGVGPKTAAALARLSIFTLEDLLLHVPRTYIDRRTVADISALQPDTYATVCATVSRCSSSASGRKKRFILTVTDRAGTVMNAKWFNIPRTYATVLEKAYPPGTAVFLSGRITRYRLVPEMHHPDIRSSDTGDQDGDSVSVDPVYPLTDGLRNTTIKKIMKSALADHIDDRLDFLPASIRSEFGLVDLAQAFRQVHDPAADDDILSLNAFRHPCQRRIIFDEFFMLQLALALRKRSAAVESGCACTISDDMLCSVVSTLPFTLTAAQYRVLREVVADMRLPVAMNRLLQGDVGSGKTVIAFLAAACSVRSGYQAVFMAPTEILAEQHYRTVTALSRRCGLTCALLTGGMTKSEKQALCKNTSAGDIDLVVGTHAVIQESVAFQRLGLAIVDEQHKFGVLQRAALKKKGKNPDVLVMTATPIPRTIGITVYGDLDVSVIDELPAGRQPVMTRVLYEHERQQAYDIAGNELHNGSQVFIVYPLVQESETIDVRDATTMAQHLQQDVFPDFRVGLLHGRMSSAEKDGIMNDFKNGDLSVLVATTVIEVGIDIPNASVMVIEHAERFGLSQLHQLRGRVGRGSTQATCILISHVSRSDDASRRLEVMERTCDGFEIAEEDFAIRGPGEMLGTRQSGMPDFRVAHAIRDVTILSDARQAAWALVDKDPGLVLPENRNLRDVLLLRYSGRMELAGIG